LLLLQLYFKLCVIFFPIFKEEIKEEITEKLIQDIEGKLTIELQARFTEMENMKKNLKI
jgi:hypothetical protein